MAEVYFLVIDESDVKVLKDAWESIVGLGSWLGESDKKPLVEAIIAMGKLNNLIAKQIEEQLPKHSKESEERIKLMEAKRTLLELASRVTAMKNKKGAADSEEE